MLTMLWTLLVQCINAVRYTLSDFSYALWDILLYYHRGSFALTDLYLKSLYVFDSPYRVSAHFRRLLPEDMTQVYGEVPLMVVERCLKLVNLTPEQTFWELGAGRGRIVFWARHFTSAHITAFDAIPVFVERGNRVINKRVYRI